MTLQPSATEARAEKGRTLGVALFEEPAAIYLYSLTSSIGVDGDALSGRPARTTTL